MRRPVSAASETIGANVSPRCSIALAVSPSLRARPRAADRAGNRADGRRLLRVDAHPGPDLDLTRTGHRGTPRLHATRTGPIGGIVIVVLAILGFVGRGRLSR
jgi:hypothetical protein